MDAVSGRRASLAAPALPGAGPAPGPTAARAALASSRKGAPRISPLAFTPARSTRRGAESLSPSRGALVGRRRLHLRGVNGLGGGGGRRPVL